jgi:hypothetical protein
VALLVADIDDDLAGGAVAPAEDENFMQMLRAA